MATNDEKCKTNNIFEITALTDKGVKRENNEDFVLIDTKGIPKTAMLADGAGGLTGGEIASEKTVRYAHEVLRDEFSKAQKLTILEIKDVIKSALRKVSNRIYKEAGSSADQIKMASTLDILVFFESHVFTGHVGDGVICRRTQTGKFFQITMDHTFENRLIVERKLSREQARIFASRINRDPRALYQAIGLPEIDPDIECFAVSPGDEYIMYSDGLSKTHPTSEIAQAVTSRKTNAAEFVNKLVAQANERKSPDNVSIVFATTRQPGPSKTAEKVPSASTPTAEEPTLKELSPNDHMEILGRVPFFSLLTELQLNRVHNLCEVRRYQPKEKLFVKGDPSDTIMIVLRGELEVFGDNPKIPINTIRVGEFVGETAVLNQPAIRTATVTARDMSEILILPGDKFKQLIKTDDKLKAHVYEYLANVLFEKTIRTSTIFEGLIKARP